VVNKTEQPLVAPMAVTSMGTGQICVDTAWTGHRAVMAMDCNNNTSGNASPNNGAYTINAQTGCITYNFPTGKITTPNDTLCVIVCSNSFFCDTTTVVFPLTLGTDTDGDLVNDDYDLDIDNDGIPNAVEIAGATNAGDTDNDGVLDQFDLDSDNDGIFDAVEAGHNALGSNGFGRLTGEAGNNGIIDALETTAESGTINYTVLDTDTDTKKNFQDLDADGDNCYDLVEAKTGASGDSLTTQHGSFSSVGNNGLANHLETNNDSDTINITPTYNIALSSQLNPCGNEVCNDGIDNNLNGYVDEFDISCQGSAINCTAPAGMPNFGIQADWSSNAVIWNGSTPTVGDLDGDGISEILIQSSANNGFYVYEGNGSNSTTASINYQLGLNSNNSHQPAIADIDDNGTPEVIIVGSDRYVYVFNNTGGASNNYLYRSNLQTQYSSGTARVTDVNEDGTPEIVVGNDVFTFESNSLVRKIVGPSINGADLSGGSGHVPVDIPVIDIIPSNPGKELVVGSRVYGINMSAGSLPLLKDLNTIDPAKCPAGTFGPTAVGDVDLDGDLDIAFAGSARLYIWDPNEDILHYDWVHNSQATRRGLPIISNFYNEMTNDAMAQNFPEVVIVTAGHLTAHNLNFPSAPLWDLATNDFSGNTGATAFDFNGDGNVEIVYRDEVTLRVMNGSVNPPVDLATFPSASATWGEHPVVADLDNDGSAEIVVTGSSRITVYEHAPNTTNWVLARNMWNQRGYRVVNIANNLRIPPVEQKINLPMPAGTNYYTLNQFQGQFNPYNLSLSPGTIAVMDANIAIDSISGTCPNLVIHTTINNTGDAPTPAGTPVAIYAGNPTNAGATLIQTITDNQAIIKGSPLKRNYNFTLGDSLTFPLTLYMVVNDTGAVNTPIVLNDLGNNGLKECDYSNNMDNELVNNCPDVDNDNVPNFLDLDNDNDGIVDSVDCNTPPLALNYSSAWSFVGTGSATPAVFQGDSIVRITPKAGSRSGAAWFRTQIDLSKSYEYEFDLYLGDSDAGADGLAFVMQTQGLNAFGGVGAGIGYQGISPSVAIEMDTYHNGNGASDFNGNDHTTINLNGSLSNTVGTFACLSPSCANVEDNQFHTVRIIWNEPTKLLSFYFDGSLRNSATIDMVNTVFGGNNMVYVGFTGSTGGAINLQAFRPRTFINASQDCPDADGDGLVNSLDIDADGDGIPDNIEAQTTASYMPPSAMVDARGIPVNYNGGITPVDTDMDLTFDFLDLDSDNEGGTDTEEANLTLGTFNDPDNDGLDNDVDTDDNNKGPVNAGITNPLNAYPSTSTEVFWRSPNLPPTIISNDSAFVQENTPTATVILDIMSVDTIDSESNSTLTYQFAGGADDNLFNLGANNGEITFKNSPDFENPQDNGTNNVYDIRVRVCDTQSACDTQTIMIYVLNKTEKPLFPVTPVDPVGMREICIDTTWTTNHPVNIMDCSGGTNGSATPNSGLYTLNPQTGCVTYNYPTGTINSTHDTVCVVVCDSKGFCDTSTLVFPIDTTPVTVPVKPVEPGEMVEVCGDTSWITASPITANDCSGNTSGNATPNGGNYTINATTGCIEYTAPANPTSTRDTVCLVICDANNVCDTTNVIFPIDTTPVTVPIKPVEPGEMVEVCGDTSWITASPITANDCSGNTSGNATPNGGNYTINATTGCIEYTAPANPTSTRDTVCLVICDANGVCDTSNVIFPIDTTPVTVPVKPVEPGEMVEVCGDTSWITASPITANDCSGNASGNATPNGGNYTINATTGCIEYTAPANPTSTRDTVCLVICDANGVCDTTNVVFPIDTTPVTVPIKPVEPGEMVEVCGDTSWITASPITANDCSGNTSGNATPNGGNYTINATTGCIEYTAPANPTSTRDTVCLVICDANGVCDTTNVIFPIDTTPVTVPIKPVEPGEMVEVCGDTSWITASPITANDCSGNASGNATPNGGNYTINATTGCIEYTAPANPTSTRDTVCLVICDANGVCDTTNVIFPIDTTPVTVPIKPVEPGEMVEVCGDTSWITASPITANDCSGNTSGNATPNGGNYTINATTGCIEYTAPANPTSTRDTVCLVICDANGVCDTTNVVFPIDTTPVTVPIKPVEPGEMVEVCGDTSWITASPITANDCSGNASGNATPNGGNYTINATTGCIEYTAPATPTSTRDTVCLVICDANGVCDTTNVVFPIDTTPVTVPVKPVEPGEMVEVCGDTSWITASPITANDCGGNTSGNATPNGGNYTINATTGCIEYTAPANPTTTKDTVCLVICDANGVCDTNKIIFPIDTTSVTVPVIPVDVGEKVTVCGDTSWITASPVTAQDCAGNTTGNATPNGGTYTIDSMTGCIDYTAPTNPSTTQDTVCLVICDGNNICDTTKVIFPIDTIDIAYPPNPIDPSEPAVVCVDQSWVTAGPISTTDCNNNSTGTATPNGGNYTINSSTGCINYTAPANATTTHDTVCVILCDANGVCDTSNVVFPLDTNDVVYPVTPVDPSEMAVVCPDTSWKTSSPLNVSDCNGNNSGTAHPNGGAYSINPLTGCVNYTYPTGTLTTLSDTVCIIICDANGICDTSDVVFPLDTTDIIFPSNPTDPNTQPIVCVNSTWVQDGPFTATDCAGNNNGVAPSNGGTYTIDAATGCVDYTPPITPLNTPHDTVCVVICDANKVCDTSIVVFPIDTIDVAMPILPVIPGDTSMACVDTSWVTAMPLTATNCDGNPIGMATGVMGNYTVNTQTGCITYVAPSSGINVPADTVCIILCDANGVCDTSQVLFAFDRDGDNIPDLTDLDDDNDGLLDSVEGMVDTDGDGIYDLWDLDSDNDGIQDVIEAGGADNNGDGRIDITGTNWNIADLDNDGLMDVVDPSNSTANPHSTLTDGSIYSQFTNQPIDTDKDGIPDFRDVDSDNDGIPDLIEAGGTDTDGDGKVDLLTDTDADGWTDHYDADRDVHLTNGLNNPQNLANNSGPLMTSAADSNANGTPGANADGGYIGGDFDGDKVPDHLDLDADNDGIPDLIETGGTDTDGDGQIDNFVDADNDGFNDNYDADDNTTPADENHTARPLITTVGEGTTVNGRPEDTNANGSNYNGLNADTDKDGQPDYKDLDADNDGIPDLIETGGTDTDGDGQVDNFVDADKDGFQDSYDPDNNTTPADENNATRPLITTDAEGTTDDGRPEDTDSNGTPYNGATADIDSDGIPDYKDLDADNDAIPDLIEVGGTDIDGDGQIDNFVDTDKDGFHNSYDPDDNTTPADENITANPLVTTDAEGTTNDGRPEDDDNNGSPYNGQLADTDTDGILNSEDLDSDNDGIPDLIEVGAKDTDNNGIVDNFTDADKDGFDDSHDPDDNTTPADENVTANPLVTTDAEGSTNDGRPEDVDTDGTVFNGNEVDTDKDGIPNYIDLDTDNDGISDLVESGHESLDTDNDGTIDADDANYADTDKDGIPNPIDEAVNTFGDNNQNEKDTDLDKTPDYKDVDADGDGILDVNEIGLGNLDIDNDGSIDETDADKDGIADSIDNNDDDADSDDFGGLVNPTNKDWKYRSIRLVRVDPKKELVTIKNFSDIAVDISGYRLCSELNYTTNLTSQTLVSGNLNLAGNAEVTLRLTEINLSDLEADLGLFITGTTDFADTLALQDFTQWGSGGNGRESIAVAKGIWESNTFLSPNELPFFYYTGSGSEDGALFWKGHLIATLTPEGEAKQICGDTTWVTNGPITVSDCNGQTNGTANGAGGSYTIDPNTACINYTAPANALMTVDSVCIIICDANNKCDTSIAIFPIDTVDTAYPTNPIDPMEEVTVCVDTSWVVKGPITARDCNNQNNGTATPNGGAYSIDANTGCVNYAAPSSVTTPFDTVCVILCDDFGICDTSIVVFPLDTVDVEYPINPVNEGDSTVVCVDTSWATAAVASITDCNNQNNGSASPNGGNYTIDAETGCVKYIAPTNTIIAVPDTVCIIVCDENKVCDTSIMVFPIDTIDIAYPVTPVDPGETKVVCPDTAWSTQSPLSVTNCAGTNSGNASPNGGAYTVDPLTGCITYTFPTTPLVSLSDTICVVVCDPNGICDTSEVVFPLDTIDIAFPPNPTDPGTFPVTCVDVTWVADGPLAATDCAGSTTGTAAANGGTYTIDPATGCVDYTPPTGTLNTSHDTVCVVVCDINQVCDTSIIVFPLDTIDVATPMYPVIPGDTAMACVDTSWITAMPLTATDCNGNPTGMATGIMGDYTINTANGCITYVAPASGVIVPADTVCIILCDANNVCDTSKVIFAFDRDGDNIPDFTDLDDDNDGITDLIEGMVDTDGDGIYDQWDLDSDNDGIQDVIEAGGADANGDGRIDITGTNWDAADADNDGLMDVVDPSTNNNDPHSTLTNGSIYTDYVNKAIDADNDGIPDFRDLDADNDGLTDLIEAGGADANGDGLVDKFQDDDQDGWSNYYDADADVHLTTGLDNPQDLVNGTGPLMTTVADANGDGTPGTNANGGFNGGDFDKDAIADFRDLDNDNDGIPNIIEIGGTDINGDGRIDALLDADNDGYDDRYDTDDDGTAGVEDSLNEPLVTTAPDGTGTDEDGRPTSAPNTIYNGQSVNIDGDNNPDFLDLDSDNDGIPDLIEIGGIDTNGDGMIDNFNDGDKDGFVDAYDPTFDSNNTPSVTGTALVATDNEGTTNDGRPEDTDANGSTFTGLSADIDGDGLLDSEDLDADNDGIPDLVEVGGTDTNGDGVIDNFNDTDKDGFDDKYDATDNENPNNQNTGSPLVSTKPANGTDPVQYDGKTADVDQDGILDSEDLDADNDGIPDLIEVGGTDTDGDGVIDDFNDADKDGFDDTYTNNPLITTDSEGTINDGRPEDDDNNGTAYNGMSVDMDKDGILDSEDLDSDNDGIPDLVEVGGKDEDGNGLVDDFTDADRDGFSDTIDPDNNNTNTDEENDDNLLVKTDGEGTTDDGRPEDTDNNGTIYIGDQADTDGDSALNSEDLDSDNDAIPDIVEGDNHTGDTNNNGILDKGDDNFKDTDGDGIVDVVDQDVNNFGDDNPEITDTDDDDIPDFIDLDTDGDGINDIDESGNGTLDLDGDGKIDNIQDEDMDGIEDTLDTNDDDADDDDLGGITIPVIDNWRKAGNASILDPCNCLGNESSLGSGDGQFSEEILVTSTSGETWTITEVKGLYKNPTAPIFPPATGGNPYPQVPYAVGDVLTETALGNGRSQYIIKGIHVDAIGYTAKVSNGFQTLNIGNTCNYSASCRVGIVSNPDGTPGPVTTDTSAHNFIIPTDNVHRFDTMRSCDPAKNTFLDDGLVDGLYIDTAARNNVLTICPQNRWQTVTVHFSEFDLAPNDVLNVYDGIGTASNTQIAVMNGTGVSAANGGWVSAHCDPDTNATGCLTFQFRTNGDNNKGTGWKASVTCNDRDIQLTPANNLVATLDCDSTYKILAIQPATVKTGCGAVQDSQIIRVFNTHGDICLDTCLAKNQTVYDTFALGAYKIEYKLKSDTAKTAEAIITIQGASLVCNDVINVPLGSTCNVLLTPDDLLETTCDTITDSVYYYITLTGVDKNGKDSVLATGGGKGGNYPMISKNMISHCGASIKATIEKRYYEGLNLSFSNNGMKSVKCNVQVNLSDQSAPIFQDAASIDTFRMCNLELTPENLGLIAPKAVDNCDEVAVKFSKVTILQDGNVCDTTRAQIVWTATDACNNTTTLNQTIIITRPTANDIVKAKTATLSCGQDQESALQDLAKTGKPGIKVGKVKNGQLIPSDTIALDTADYVCGYILKKEDIQIPADCGIKVFRYWSVLDWCDASQGIIALDTQLIELKDTLAPTFDQATLPFLDLELAHGACTYDISKLAQPTATDNCSAVTVRRDKVFRVEDGKLWELPLSQITALDADSFAIRWIAEDACHEQTKNDTIIQSILIKDLTLPAAICTDQLNVALGTESTKVHYRDIDKGSNDACGISKYEVSRNEIDWDSTVTFTCEDVHQSIKVYLRVTDASGNSHTCWTTVIVEDKIAPICSALPDQTETCDALHAADLGTSTDANNNGLLDDAWVAMSAAQINFYNERYGNPVCSDNLSCNALTIEQQYQLVEKHCGIVKVQRRYRAIDWNGEGNQSNWVIQNINIEYKADWTITLPADWQGACGDDIPTSTIEIKNGKCDLMGYEVEEKTYTTTEDACLKVVRTFTITNWCNYDPNAPATQIARTENGHGLVTASKVITAEGFEKAGKLIYTQVLKLKDDTAPVITINDTETCIESADCQAVKQFSVSATDCNEAATAQLKYQWELSANDKVIANGAGASFEYLVAPKVGYKVKWTVFDNCGNSAWEEIRYEFWDCKKPSPYCIHGLAIELMSTSTQQAGIQIWAKDLNQNSFDNCTAKDKLRYRIWHASLGTAPSTTEEVVALPEVIDFDCRHVGQQAIQLYVIDEENNWDYCITYVIVQDNLGNCTNNNGMALVNGLIMDWKDRNVEEVEMTSKASNADKKAMMTKADGLYQFELAMHQDYTIQPQKDIQPLNGVSTFDLVIMAKHILGVQSLSNPYQMIAADVNKSGTITAFDMVQLRRLILSIDNQFSNNTSWRFVKADYEFTTENPLTEAFPEVAAIKDLSQDMTADFVAIKVGDVNGNAKANSFVLAENRNSNTTFEIEIPEQNLKAGQSYSTTFYTTQIEGIQGYQFTLNYKDLQLNKLTSGLSKVENFGLHQMDNGFVTTSWNQSSLVPNTEHTNEKVALFTIEYTALFDGKLSEQLAIIDRPTTIEAYDSNGDLMEIELNFTTPIADRSFELFQNQPNPFIDKTSIGFYLPGDSEVKLILRDETGRVLRVLKENRTEGFNKIQLEDADLSNGFIYYQLSTKFGTKARKMLHLK
jgi:hypothetical protein